MIYSNFGDLKISALGMGCMRLPTLNNYAEIDTEATKKMIAYAMEKGVNYYDTAWIYHGGNSETVVGEILSEYPRDSYYIASKFPGFELSLIDKVEEIFEKQIEKCKVGYFDFYLFHNVCEINIEQYLDPKYRIYDYLMAQKKNGRIRHLGFSAHGSLETMKRFLDAYGKDMEFCQLQINWLDWEFQNAKAKVELVSSYGIPVWVMEPLRGGSLVNIKSEYEERVKTVREGITTPELAFRFLQSIPEVKMTLSGMSNFKQLKENIATYETNEPLSETEREKIISVARDMTKKKSIPCTACRYCTENCPMELDIPKIAELYNEKVYSGGSSISRISAESLKLSKLPSECIGCRACETACPQNIEISEMMSDFASNLK